MGFRWPFGVMERVICGREKRPRLIFRDPDKAYPLFAKDKSVDTKLAMDLLERVTAEIGVKFASAIRGFLVVLDNTNAGMLVKFRKLYIDYLADVCSPEAYATLTKGGENMYREEGMLRRLMVTLQAIRAIVEAGYTGDELRDLIVEVLDYVAVDPEIAERKVAVEDKVRRVRELENERNGS